MLTAATHLSIFLLDTRLTRCGPTIYMDDVYEYLMMMNTNDARVGKGTDSVRGGTGSIALSMHL